MSQTAPIRAGIVHACPIYRVGLRHILDDRPGLQVVADAPSVEELEAAGEPADVVVLDLYLESALPALDLVERVSARSRVMVLVGAGARADVLAAIMAGATGCLTNHGVDLSEIAAAVEAVGRGALYLPAPLAGTMRANLRPQGAPAAGALTPRERQALRHIAHGLTHAQAARRMGVTVGTVNTYVKRIREKLGVGNKADLTRKAIELGMDGLVREEG